jgi:hypothetical protein
MYYNQLGGLCGIPAPLRYAYKMGRQAINLGIQQDECVLAHEHYDKAIHGLYYL